MSNEKALRFNSGKLDLTYCPYSIKHAVAAVFSLNSEKQGGKYPDNNWRKGLPYMSVIASLERHMEAFKSGENYDPESQLPHLWHAACNLAMLIEYTSTLSASNLDDRLESADIERLTGLYTFAVNSRNTK